MLGCALALLGLLVPLRVLAQASEPAAAESPKSSDEEVAKGLFQAARAAFDAGRMEEALDYFQRAYAQFPRPELLYNIGQTADRLRMDELALDSFRKYLDQKPTAENREAVENRVSMLEQLIAERKAKESQAAPAPETTPSELTPAPAEPEPEAPRDESSSLPLGPIITAAVGVALIGGGAVFGLAASSAEDEYASAPVRNMDEAARARELLDDAESQALLCNVLLVAGGAALLGAGIWLVLDDGEPESEPSLAAAPVITQRFLGIAIEGRLPEGP